MSRRFGWMLVVLLGWVGTGRADGVPLRVDQSAERMRVDGALREWQGARFASLTGAGESGLRYALATADGGLYLGVEVSDDQLVRSQGVGSKQDALVLSLALPTADARWVTSEVWLHAGESGRSKAEAGLKSGSGAVRPEAKIKVVEGPREKGQPGYVLEAFVPWSLVAGAEIWEQARGALRYEDVDASSSKPSLVATAAADKPAAMPRLALGEGQQDFLGSFLRSQNLGGLEPRYDLRGNVHGDGSPERVAIVDRFVVVHGPGYQKGESYGFVELPIGLGGGLKQAELVDLDTDGLAELVLTLRQSNEQGAREVWLVYSLAEQNPRALGGVELRKELSGGFIENTLELSRKAKAPARITVRVGRSQNVEAANYRENAARDVQPILLPWAATRARTYGFSGGALVLISEENDPKLAARAAASSSAASGTRAPAASKRALGRASEEESEQMLPVEPSLELVLALFKRDRKLPAGLAPRRHQRANLLGGPEPEELFELGNSLVVMGPDIDGGASYFAYNLPVKDPAETLYVGHADVTGDGREELFVRLAQPLSGAEGVRREIVLVLAADEARKFRRLLAAEVARRQGDSAVINRVVTRGGQLVIEPGTAEGWSSTNYPFTQDTTGGVEGLLLPWQDQSRAYRLSAGTLVAAP